VLRSLSARAMTLEAAVTILGRDDVDHLLTVEVGDRQHVIGQALATSVFVSPRRTGESNEK